MKIGVIITIFVVLFLGLLAYSTIQGPRYRAEICMDFNSHKACKTVTAKSEDAALRAGAEGSCAEIAFGVTDTMKCIAAQPASVKWLKRP